MHIASGKNKGEASTGAVIFFVILIVAACLVFFFIRNTNNQSPINQAQDNINSENSGVMPIVTVPLLEQSASGQSGTVIFSDEAGKTKVVVNITPGPKDVAQPATIHGGDCTGLGSLKYQLNDIVNGESETVLTPSLHFIHGQGETSLHIGKSKAQSAAHVVCGDLLPAFNTAMGD